MAELRSKTSTSGRTMAGARALWRATGMTDDDFGKPIIAVANSFTQFVPGHVHLKDLGGLVCDAIAAAGVPESCLSFAGPAKVYESQEDAVDAIMLGEVVAGDVVVIRYEGPRGGPGMQEMLYPTSFLKGRAPAGGPSPPPCGPTPPWPPRPATAPYGGCRSNADQRRPALRRSGRAGGAGRPSGP